MTKIAIKQLNNGGAQNGSVIVFEDGRNIWSSAASGAILVPGGATFERPTVGTSGHLRYNSEQDNLEAYLGDQWRSLSFQGVTNTSVKNMGTGTGLYAQTVGTELQFKSIAAGSLISLSTSGDTITVSSDAAPTNSPDFTGVPTAPTPVLTSNDTTIATTAFVKGQGYLTGNQNITITGDASGSGTTSILLSLVNTGVTAGTYTKLTVDAKGRVTAAGLLAATDIPNLDWSKITSGKPTTLTGYGITDVYTKTEVDASLDLKADTATTLDGYGILDAVQNAGDTPSIAAGLTTVRPIAGTAGRLFISTDAGKLERDTGTAWSLVSPAYTGDVTKPIGSTTLTLSDTGVTAGTYNSVTVNSKGRITTATSVAYLTANQTITLTGDVTGSGTTTITTALSNTGVSAGTYTKLTVDAKGRVTAGTSLSSSEVTTALGYSPLASVSNLGTGNGIYAQTTANSAQLKSLVAGENVSIISNNDTITISATGGSSQVVTAPTTFYAGSFDNPGADWAITQVAPAQSDPSRVSMTVRAFDDTQEEGIGFPITVPTGVTTMNFSFKHRASTAPTTARNVVLRLYRRNIPNNAAVGAWSAAVSLATLSIPVNTNYQYTSAAVSLATLGLTPGTLYLIEIVRYGGSGTDTLVGDWLLFETGVWFT